MKGEAVDGRRASNRGYIPGDTVEFYIQSFLHEMHLEEVTAVFEQELPSDVVRNRRILTLKGVPSETELPQHMGPGQTHKVSQVVLKVQIARNINPGDYQCRRLYARTFGGRDVDFDATAIETWGAWRFRVRSEPDTPPSFSM